MADQIDLELVRSGAKDLSRTDLRNADLTGRDLSRADFSGAKLDRIRAKDANLSGANLSSASIIGADFSNANLTAAILPSVMVAVKFNNSNLSGAKIRFRGQQVDFASADISGADFEGGVFGEDMKFDNVKFDEKTRFDNVEMLRSTSRYTVFGEYRYYGGKLVRKDEAAGNAAHGEQESSEDKGDDLRSKSPPDANTSNREGNSGDLARTIEIRLAEAPKGFALMAAMLSAAVREELEEMQSSRPNRPDNLVRFEGLTSFLEELAKSLDRLAEAIEQASKNPGNGDYSLAREIVTAIRDRIESWASENKDMVAGIWRTGVIGVSTSFLTLCGAPATYAALMSMATFGGPKLIEAVKDFARKGGDD
ncbi:MAG: pentapeptide repeat-containing protein [Mesorhizobium sp.]|nr:MAG: pentapeptide repeat-containing protein [Mesorhizobium sp.]